MSLSDQQWCPTSAQVTVLQARGLRIKGKSGTNDAYAVMQVGKEKYQTSVVEKSVAPVWKEEAAFDLPPLLQQQGGGGERGTLRVHVLHRALVGPDKLLGQAVINLLQLSEDRTRNKTEWFKLLDKTGKPDKDRGEVLVDIQFTRNNMTASMFDLSAAGKSRSRLGKLKDKVRGKKKESDASSNVVPSFTQVLTDSEEEGNQDGGEVAAGKDEKKKKHKMKSLFSSKSNLQRNMSQSMSVLPAKNSSLSGSQSSGLNMDSAEGKKKFKFMKHKRSGSSDSKDSSAAQQKHGSVEQSNLCINGSHVYCEEQQPRTARIGSNFSLASSGHGSMEDVPESSPPSVDSLRAVRQYSPWTEEEEEEAEVENKREDKEEMRIKEEMVRRQELEKLEEEKRRLEEEERMRIEEEEHKREEEERIRKEEKRAEEEERVRREEEEERERLVEEKRRQEEQERRRVEEEKIQREEQNRMEEERAQEERRKEEEERARRQEEERERLAEEKRRQEEEEERNRIEEVKARKEEEERIRREEERAQEERRRKEEERVRRQEEEREELAEEKRRQEEKARKEEEERIRREEERAQEEKMRQEERVRRLEEEERRQRKEEEERIRKEEERRQEEKVRKEEYERLLEEKKKLEEEKRKIIEEENIRREEEERKRTEETKRRKEEEEERVRRQEEEQRRMEEEEKIRKEEDRRRQEEEEMARKEKEEHERLAEEKRKLDEEERKRIEEEERLRREEQERIRMEEEKRRRQEEEERVRKEKEEKERLAEEMRLKEQEKRRIEEEERIRMQEQAEKERKEEEEEEEEARKLQKEAEEQKKKENQTKDGDRAAGKHSKESAGVTSSNPLDESVHSPAADTVSSVQQRCLDGSAVVSADVGTQREKRQAPRPPGRNQAERPSQREPDTSTQHLAQINKPGKEKDVKTASVLPLHPLSGSPTDTKSNQSLTLSSTSKGTAAAAKHTKRPAPSRPRAAEEEPIPQPKTSRGFGSEAKQVPVVHSLNPFDEDEKELTAQDDRTASAKTGSVLWPPAVSQAHDEDDASQTKIKSAKIARAPPPPAKTAVTSSTLNKKDTDGDRVTDGTGVPDNSATQACDPKPEAKHSVPVQEPATAQRAAEATGGKKEVSHATSRRLQPVKPLNPLDQQSVSAVQGKKENKSTGIRCDVQDNSKVKGSVAKGPYSQLTQEELVSLVLKQETQLSERDKKISELELYIDNLLVRVIEENPSILMSLNSLKKTT